MVGLVLSGGKSSRMGSDKGLLCFRGMRWAAIANEKLQSLGLDTWISVNRSQYSVYKKALPNNHFILDSKAISVKGPLLGLLSAHIRFPEDDILVLACNLLEMEATLFQGLIEEQQGDKIAQAVMYRVEGELQPLCAIYSADMLKRTLSIVEAGCLENFSLKRVLSSFDLAELKCTENEKNTFKNFNTLSELSNYQVK